MTLNIEGKLIIDTSELDAAERQAEIAVANQKKATIEVKKQVDGSFDEVMGMMRASYMMVSGIAGVLGGTMGQIFSTMYATIVSTIQTTAEIAAAIAASGPWGWVQAGIMTASLVSALVSMVGIFSGQEELSRRTSGLTMSLQGMSAMLGTVGGMW